MEAPSAESSRSSDVGWDLVWIEGLMLIARRGQEGGESLGKARVGAGTSAPGGHFLAECP